MVNSYVFAGQRSLVVNVDLADRTPLRQARGGEHALPVVLQLAFFSSLPKPHLNIQLVPSELSVMSASVIRPAILAKRVRAFAVASRIRACNAFVPRPYMNDR